MTTFTLANLGDAAFNILTGTLNGSGTVGSGVTFVDNTSAAPVLVDLPTGLAFCIIKDASHTAGTLPIIITPESGQIENALSYTISSPGAWVVLSWDGSNYWIIG